jgi:hypothetical protein
MTGQRHKGWTKLAPHKYIALCCGLIKINEPLDAGGYQQRYHLTNGDTKVLSKVPPCEQGSQTAARLKLYQDFIAGVSITREHVEQRLRGE